jgi:hypothetical protein
MIRHVLLALATAMSLAAQAVEPVSEVPMRDPWVPPAVRKSLAAPSRAIEGAALRAQVERKLREPFDAAAGSTGTLTRIQARDAGLGFIASHFDAIDRRQTGTITFEDYKAFLKARGASLD